MTDNEEEERFNINEEEDEEDDAPEAVSLSVGRERSLNIFRDEKDTRRKLASIQKEKQKEFQRRRDEQAQQKKSKKQLLIQDQEEDEDDQIEEEPVQKEPLPQNVRVVVFQEYEETLRKKELAQKAEAEDFLNSALNAKKRLSYAKSLSKKKLGPAIQFTSKKNTRTTSAKRK